MAVRALSMRRVSGSNPARCEAFANGAEMNLWVSPYISMSPYHWLDRHLEPLRSIAWATLRSIA